MHIIQGNTEAALWTLQIKGASVGSVYEIGHLCGQHHKKNKLQRDLCGHVQGISMKSTKGAYQYLFLLKAGQYLDLDRSFLILQILYIANFGYRLQI